jgi:2',3'-cyclic-nucleotide 2'-phosphodiesterase/3'-nucleotidase/5'-nucleotidase
MLGDNTFGFEDMRGGGDKDFNDILVKVNLTPV